MGATAILLAILALAVGAIIGYLYGSSRSRTGYDARLREAETGRAGLEATTTELRAQLEGLRAQFQTQQSRLESETAQRVATEAALEAADKSLAEQRQALEETKEEMKSVFRALASEALSATTQQFLELARVRLEGAQEQANQELETRKLAVEAMVNPLAETLGKLEAQLGVLSQNESALKQAHGDLSARLAELRQETGTLATALRQPNIRGSWGELSLRRAVELAGMSSHCDFVEQQTLSGEAGRLRPDLIVKMPGGRNIAIDAKVPLEAFLRAARATNPRERQQAMEEHVRAVRAHLRQLGSKAYWSQFPSAPEFVVLFMPGESFFSAALESDRQLLEDALGGEDKVLPASPITLIALLMAVEHGWRQQQMEENTRQIARLGKELYDRIGKFVEHLGGVREGLDKASRAYNGAVGSFNDRLLPSARRLGELGVSGEPELAALEPTEVELRQPPREDGANPPEE